MKTCTWVVSVFFDDAKTDKMFEKTYKNISGVLEDFNLKKMWFSDIFRRNKREYKCYRHKFKKKYKRMIITKYRHTKEGDIKEVFQIND